MDEDTSWQKQLLVATGMLVVVGLLVGGVIAVVALKAADVAGVGRPRVQSTEPPPGLSRSTPPPTKTTTNSPATLAAPTTSAPTTSAPTTTTTQPRPQRAIRLLASPQQAGTYERVDLSGVYRGAADGTTLQVQRDEGSGWADFPTSATVSAGTFATYIVTGVTGLNRFRMLDTVTGRASNVVKVFIS